MPSKINPISGHARPASGAELRKWLFMRISGLLLIFLALGHLWIMHIQNNVATIDYDFVLWRFSFWFWRAYDGLLLTLALFHGVMGTTTLIEDMIANKRLATIISRSLLIISTLFWIVGLIVLITFKAKV